MLALDFALSNASQLSATMLSDNSEKSRNPLKKAMRRRNAKTVQFAAPTYVEASDYDYSTDDEDPATSEPSYETGTAHVEDTQHAVEAEPRESIDSNLSDDDEARFSAATKRASFDREQAATQAPSVDDPQTSPKLVDKTEAAPLKSRKGTPRNTDSFLRDDSIETKKITITPGLLREDTLSIKSASSESTRNPSMENLVKSASPTEQRDMPKKETKDKKKEKQKGGMLSGLFKKKDKKDKKGAKEEHGNESDMEKPSSEYSRESPRSSPVPSGSSSPIDKSTSVAQASKQAPAKGRLQKQAPPKISSPIREPAKEAENRAFVAELPGAEVAHEMAAGNDSRAQREFQQQQAQQQQIAASAPAVEREKEGGLLSPIRNALSTNNGEPKPKKAKRSKSRVELDDFDDSPVDEEGPNPFKEQEERQRANSQEDERLSESPVEIMPGTFMHGTEIVHIPMPGEGIEEDDGEAPASLSSSPSIIEHPAEPAEETEQDPPTEDDEATPTAPGSPQPDTQQQIPSRDQSADSTTSSTRRSPNPATTPTPPSPTWSDTHLRAWYDDGSDVKDLLTLIHDSSHPVMPVAPDHPLMAGLFVEERQGVQKMMGDLDGLLGAYLQRKGLSMG